MRKAKRLSPLASASSVESRIWPSSNRPDATTTTPAALTTTTSRYPSGLFPRPWHLNKVPGPYYYKTMKFIFKTSRLDNLYFFVSNLTEFHFSCRKHFNVDWILATGPLDQKEKKAINNIRPIFEKYGFAIKNDKYLYLGKYFYCPDDKEKFGSLKKYLLPEEYEAIRVSFSVIEKRFNKIYNKKLLENWKLALEKELSSEKFLKLFNFAQRFFNATKVSSVINVHLLMSPSMTWSASGNANLGDRDITLEAPVFNLTEEQIELAVCILLHELSHIWFENSSNYLTAKKLSGDNLPLVKEILIDSISPSGFPAQKYSKASNPLKRFLFNNLADGFKAYENFINNKEADKQKLSAYVSWFIYPLVAYYYANDKKLDKKFIKAIAEIIKKAGDL